MNDVAAQVDLTNCDREPIHQLGLIQDFGALIAVNAEWYVAHRSANAASMLGIEGAIEQGDKLADLFDPSAMEKLRGATKTLDDFLVVERLFGIKLTSEGEKFDCAVHRSGSMIVIEFEPHADEDEDHLGSLSPMMAELEKHRDISYMCNAAAQQLKRVLGFDRVMVYRFHEDDSGEVFAEAREPDLEAFLRLRYPKTDIPVQARALYLANPFRIISDVNAEPVSIEPSLSFEGEPLDLTHSTLRAVSPIHVEYLKNMGVAASLSISIIIEGKLWGLFACHHYSPRVLPYSQRTRAELYSNLFSLMLGRLLSASASRLRGKGRAIHDGLMARLAGGAPLVENLLTIDQVIGQIVPHDGSSAYVDGVYKTRGTAPTEEEFKAIIGSLNSAPTSTIVASNSLSSNIPAAEAFSERAVGALIIPVSRKPRDYLVFWRKELKQTVTWAGNPEKPVELGPNGARLTPRESFEAWQEEVTGTSAPWSEDEKSIAESLRVTLLEVILRMTEEAVQERARANEHQELLISELNHRVRNILNLIRGLINQSRHNAMDIEDFTKLIGGRISALASAHDNITRGNWSHASVRELIETESEAYVGESGDRVRIEGDDRLVAPEAYTVLALVIHEMMTNSAKYGALCDSSGSLTITLEEDQDGDLAIKWLERGGPPVKKPERRGFGSTIIERSIPYELSGVAEVEYKLQGVEGQFIIPSRYLAKSANEKAVMAERKRSELAPAAPPSKLPKHVLVVEDSMIIALDCEDCLLSIGVKDVDIAGSVSSAMDALSNRRPDFVVLDYNLGTESSDPVAAELRKRQIPFVLATGYGEMADRREEIGFLQLLQKPYSKEDIERALAVFVEEESE